jgi:endonuclease YncB( thermonuclease family)
MQKKSQTFGLEFLTCADIKQGYGHALTRYPFSRMEEFRQLEREAREQRRGLWAISP